MRQSLVPLRNSWATGQVEEELRALFIKLYEDSLKEQADEINVYGAPHLGSVNLIARHVEADGLALLNNNDETGLRYLFKAWRYQNPDRGLHFLRTYLRVIFGDNQNVEQLWQKKTEPYPTSLKPKHEVESESEYFLTSRLQVDLDNIDIVPDRIIRTLRTAIAARFVLMFRVAKFCRTEIGLVSTFRGVNVLRLQGEVIEPSGNLNVGLAHVVTGTVLAYTRSE